jgi:hypothetical protein
LVIHHPTCIGDTSTTFLGIDYLDVSAPFLPRLRTDAMERAFS